MLVLRGIDLSKYWANVVFELKLMVGWGEHKVVLDNCVCSACTTIVRSGSILHLSWQLPLSKQLAHLLFKTSNAQYTGINIENFRCWDHCVHRHLNVSNLF